MTNLIPTAMLAGFSEQDGIVMGGVSDLFRFASLIANAAVVAEREACAKVCEEEICNCCWDEGAQAAAEYLVDLIRARSEK